MAQSTVEANRLMDQQRLGGFDYPNDEVTPTFTAENDDWEDDCEDDEVDDHLNGVGV